MASSKKKDDKTNDGKKNWPASTWVAIVAAFISVVSSGVALYFGLVAKDHYHLSMRPYITISFDYDDTGAGFHMSNDGPGPAVIGSFVILVDDKAQRTWEQLAKTLALSDNFHWHKKIPYPSTTWSRDEEDTRLY